MLSKKLQYGAGFCLILMLFLLRTALAAPSSSGDGGLETVAQRLHKGDPFAFVYTALDTSQELRERIPTSFSVQDLVRKGTVTLSERLIGPLPVPSTLPSATVHGVQIQPARLDQLDSYLRQLFSWAM